MDIHLQEAFSDFYSGMMELMDETGITILTANIRGIVMVPSKDFKQKAREIEKRDISEAVDYLNLLIATGRFT